MAKVTSHNISRRKNGWFLNVRYDDDTRKQLKAESLAHAHERLREVLTADEKAKPSTAPVLTIADAWESLEKYYAGLQFPDSHMSQLRDVVDYFGSQQDITAIGFLDVEKFQTYLLENVGNSPSTVNAKVSKIKKMREMAVRAGATSLPPLPKNVPLQHVHKDLWKPEVFQAVCDDLTTRGEKKVVDMLVFLHEMGCRHSEAYRLRSGDVDLRKGTVHFFKPNPDHKNQNRILPMTAAAIDAVSDHLSAGKRQYVWRFAADQKRSHVYLYHQVDRSLQRFGIKKKRPIHTLRDTCLSRLGQAGCTAFEIMQWSGHKDLKSVALYVQMDMSRLEKMRSILSESAPLSTGSTQHAVDLRQVAGKLQQPHS